MSKSKHTAPNAGTNRKQKRELAKKPQTQTSSKPLWLRIAIIAIMAAMLLGIVLMPLMR